jgi:hypothetical protein
LPVQLFVCSHVVLYQEDFFPEFIFEETQRLLVERDQRKCRREEEEEREQDSEPPSSPDYFTTISYSSSSSSSRTTPQLQEVRITTPSPIRRPLTPPTRRPLTPPRTVESLWQPYVQKIAQHDRLQQCLATNCSGRLGNNQTNLLITIGDRTFGLCETTHLKDPSLAMEVEMILQAALNLVGVSNK